MFTDPSGTVRDLGGIGRRPSQKIQYSLRGRLMESPLKFSMFRIQSLPKAFGGIGNTDRSSCQRDFGGAHLEHLLF
jgi:hypothetical protein